MSQGANENALLIVRQILHFSPQKMYREQYGEYA